MANKEEEKKTHWRELIESRFIGSHTMPKDGSDITLTIKEIVVEQVMGEDGEKDCRVAYFVEDSKPMILNDVNSNIISSLYKTPFIEEWKDKKIQIYTAKNVATRFGMTEGLRIRQFIPLVTIKELFEQKKKALSETELKRFTDILDKGESASYQKLYDTLQSKNI